MVSGEVFYFLFKISYLLICSLQKPEPIFNSIEESRAFRQIKIKSNVKLNLN